MWRVSSDCTTLSQNCWGRNVAPEALDLAPGVVGRKSSVAHGGSVAEPRWKVDISPLRPRCNQHLSPSEIFLAAPHGRPTSVRFTTFCLKIVRAHRQCSGIANKNELFRKSLNRILVLRPTPRKKATQNVAPQAVEIGAQSLVNIFD